MAWASINKVSGVQLTGTNLYSAHLVAASSQAFSAVDHADFKPTGAFTIGGWVKAASATTPRYLYSSQGSGTPNYDGMGVYITTGHKIDIDSARNTGTTENVDCISVTGGVTVDDGNWHWVVCTYDGSNIYIYIDGTEDTHSAWTHGVGYKATNYVRVGVNYSGYNYGFFDGNLDEVFLINGTAWSSSDVTNYYKQSITGATNLKAYYQLENGLTDSSGNSHTLTAIGSPTYSSDVPFTGIRVNKVAGVQN